MSTTIGTPTPAVSASQYAGISGAQASLAAKTGGTRAGSGASNGTTTSVTPNPDGSSTRTVTNSKGNIVSINTTGSAPGAGSPTGSRLSVQA